ncbi:choice-of-anchor D domain-containing protein [Edaphobacter albus]|uniref:choice-of-anchor D domain-containing protein n=1 Tax=Edaphobacter sp. 4G125 TaxID=2763071 RepID=UPI0021035FEF|nr:choice-of-anchor D domain-containing protein [Edaphobacter sp. 4G125]
MCRVVAIALWMLLGFLTHGVAQTRFDAPWQPLGPAQVMSTTYGKVTGRITAIAIDPADATGNTVYLGTTGGGVWKSTNAAGPASAVTFTPLTDTLPVFRPNAGNAAIPSLSIGALSVQGSLVLAGTGDPNDAVDSFYGQGLLRSTDGGLIWTLVSGSQDVPYQNYFFKGLAFAGLAWSTTSSNTVVAALSQSGEGMLVGSVDPSQSIMGLYYSTDAGVTWHMSTIKDGSQVVQQPLPTGGITSGGNAATSVVWNPVRKRFYAAVRFHGYYESADGVTWTRLVQQPGVGLTTSACPVNPNLVGSSNCPIFRGVLAVDPVSGDMYALTVSSGNHDQGLWRDACSSNGTDCAGPVSFGWRIGGSSLESACTSSASNDCIQQGDYNLSLAAVATGSDTLIFAGAVDLYRCSLSSGCAVMRNTTNALNGCGAPAKVAPAQHAIAVRATGSTSVLLLGNDGGLWRSNDGVNQQGQPCSPDDAVHFENLNGGLGSLAEVESVAEHPSDPSIVLAGMGANGTAATTSASTTGFDVWPQLGAGEGGMVAIDPANPELWYITTKAGVSIRRCTKGSACTSTDFAGDPTIGYGQTAMDASLIHTPWLLDPALTTNLIVGTCRVWRGPAEDANLWATSNAISAMFAGSQGSACATTNALIRSLAAGGPSSNAANAQSSGSQVIYAGMAGNGLGGGSAAGHLFVTQAAERTTGTNPWSDVTASPVINAAGNSFNPKGYDVSSVAVDPHDVTGNTVYVTIRGFGVPHVYLSQDAGAHWTNISRNLPDAPANSIVVDPNDANTVYVAMDTGVYATTQVSTCGTSDCWTAYGTGLPNAPVMQLAAAQAMATGDGRTGELRVATYGRGIWQIPLLTATLPAQAAISVSPAALVFTDQAIGTASAVQSVAVTNTGNAPLNISQVTVSLAQLPLGPQAEFFETDNCIGSSVAVGQSCTLQVRFGPAAAGDRTATLTVYANVAGGQATVPLSGKGISGGNIVLTPLFLSFGSVDVNATSPAQNLTLSNTGTADVNIGAPLVTGDFHISANTCGAILKSSSGCTVGITFTPASSGVRAGSFSITGDGAALTSSLNGSGTLPATDTIAPMALSFAAQPLGTSSSVQRVILTNAGDTALKLITAQTTGDFIAVNSCGNSLAGHASCSIGVIFQPTVLGAAAGSLTISDQYRAQSVTLSGTAVAPPGVSLSPLFGMNFPATGVGISSSPQMVTLTNNGGVPLAISTIALSGDFTVVPDSNRCGDSLAVGAACTMQIAFRPTAGGVRPGTLVIADNATNSPQTLPLTGVGVDFAIAINGSPSVAISSGQSAVFPLLFTSGPTAAGLKVNLSCSGAPVNSTCNITPASLSLDGNATTVSVTVQTGVVNLSQKTHARRYLWFALLLPVGLVPFSRRRWKAMALLSAVLMAGGCGGGRLIPPSGGPGSGSGNNAITPSGTYNLVVTATSAGLTRTVNLTLVVQ